MTDRDKDKSVVLSTPEERYLELYDGKKLVRLKSEHCELLFNDKEQYAMIDAGGHKIRVNYPKEGKNRITVMTVNGAVIDMDDEEDIITLQTAAEKDGKKTNVVVLNGKDEAITIDSKDNTGVFNGKEARITLESKDSKVAIDGSEDTIIMENKDNKVVINSGDNSVSLDAKKDVNIKAGGNVNIKAKGKFVVDANGGVSNAGQTVKMSK
jgi:hypothetical protein